MIPTRNGRNAMAFADTGPIRLRNAVHERDQRPLEENCPCPACRHSRGYLRHLFVCGEMLGPILLTAHNLTYYQRLLADARQAIVENRFADFAAARFANWQGKGEAVRWIQRPLFRLLLSRFFLHTSRLTSRPCWLWRKIL